MELLNQPFNGQLGEQLIEWLESPDYHTLNIAVAFAKNSGVLRVKNSLEKFRDRGGVVNVYVGVDLGVTSHEALTNLLLYTDSLNVVHSEKGQTFHSKIYQLLGSKKGVLVVGSHNLTGGGLWTNFESSAHTSLDMSNSDDIEVLKVQEEYFKCLASLNDSFMPITVQEDIDNLLKNGYISKEVSQRVRSKKTAEKSGSQARLFGNGVPAVLPRVPTPAKEVATEAEEATEAKETTAATNEVSTGQAITPTNDEYETIWFESKSMTGGSRNILDLSMKSLVESGETEDTPFDIGEPGFISGGVKFFGLDPTDTNSRKDITINFEGNDYTGNTILFPEGDKANGTWRLQIKGQSLSGVKITEAFKDLNSAEGKRYNHNGDLLLFLQFKIITFTKVKGDYYFMSVFPESELDDFRDASKILARNGQSSQARQLGLL